MPRLLITVALVLLGASYADAQTCSTPQPGPINGQSWVCANGGWRPPTMTPPPTDIPYVGQTPASPAFQLGHRYTRGTTDIYILGTGQTPEGLPVLVAMCMAIGEECTEKGALHMLRTNAITVGWTKVAEP